MDFCVEYLIDHQCPLSASTRISHIKCFSPVGWFGLYLSRDAILFFMGVTALVNKYPTYIIIITYVGYLLT